MCRGAGDAEIAFEHRGIGLQRGLAASCTIAPRSNITTRSASPRIFCAFCSTIIEQMPPARVMVPSALSSSSTMIGASPRSARPAAAARIERQRAADRQHLLLAAGELVAEIVAALLQPRKHFVDLSTVHGPGCATAVMFSSTVSERKMLRSCGTQPIPARARWSGRIAVMSARRARTCRRSGG
jgi:hypothetical protein